MGPEACRLTEEAGLDRVPVAQKSKLREYLETLVVALLLAFAFRATVAEARYIPSESMLPTLHVQDRLIVEKLSYRFHLPSRGDIVVFDPPASVMDLQGNAFIKRVVGLPGDRLDIRGGKLHVNGHVVEEAYVRGPARYDPPNWDAIGLPGGVVPPNCVLVLGDNRNNSQDGHIWGPLPVRNIIGRTVFRFWPPKRVGPIERPAYPPLPQADPAASQG